MSAAPLCVYCRQRPAKAPWHPFCSDRCKMADLGRWLGGHYRVPDAEAPGAPDDADEDADTLDRLREP